MTGAELRALVESIVRSVLERPPSQSLLIVLGGAEWGADDAAFALGELRRTRNCTVYSTAEYSVRNPSTQSTHNESGLGKIKREALVDASAEALFLLPLAAAVSRVACNVPHGEYDEMLMRALSHGIPTTLAGGDCSADFWPAAMPRPMARGTGSLLEIIEGDIARLERWGLRYFPTARAALPSMLPSGDAANPSSAPRRFLTADDIYRMHNAGTTEYVLKPGESTTDAALELAAQFAIEIVDAK